MDAMQIESIHLSGRNRPPVRAVAEGLGRLPSHLLVLNDGRVLPTDPLRRRHWREALQEVADSRVARFFVLQSEPFWIVAALVPDNDGVVHVRLSRLPFIDQRRLQATALMLALTPREAEVLGLLLQGGSARTISNRLGTSLTTVRTQLAALRSKGGMSLRDLVRMVAALPPLDVPDHWDNDQSFRLDSINRDPEARARCNPSGDTVLPHLAPGELVGKSAPMLGQ